MDELEKCLYFDIIFAPKKVLNRILYRLITKKTSFLGAGHSTHITLSAYANNSWLDYFLATVQQITGNTSHAVALRSGLPFNYHNEVNQKNYPKVLEVLRLQIFHDFRV